MKKSFITSGPGPNLKIDSVYTEILKATSFFSGDYS